MVIRKPKKSYEDVRKAALAHKGHLSPPSQPAMQHGDPKKDGTEKPTHGALAASPGEKPQPKPPAKPKNKPADKTAEKTATPPAKAAAVELSPETAQTKTVRTRIIVPRPKPGVSEAYDKISDAMGPEIALKAIVKKAIASVADLQHVDVTQNTDLFEDDKSNRLRTNRLLNAALVHQMKHDLDPYDVLSEYTLGLKIGQLIVAAYLHASADAE